MLKRLPSILIFIFFVFAAARVFALNPENNDSRRNPFLTEDEQEKVDESTGEIKINYLKLSMVAFAGEQSSAVIDGRVVKKGDIVDGKEVVEIRPESVILKDNLKKFVIKMDKVLDR